MGAAVGRSWDSDAADSGTGPWPWPWLWLQVRRDIALAGGKLVILEVVVGVNVIAFVHLVVLGLDAVSISTTMRGAGDGILHIFIAISVKIMLIIITAITSLQHPPSAVPSSALLLHDGPKY